MGFLRRWLGGDGSGSRQQAFDVTVFTGIRPDAQLALVGEAYRQLSVLTARPPSETDLPSGMPPPPAGYDKALLAPEPTNPHDRNAVAGYLWAGGFWAIAGYLSRDDALRYLPLFAHLGRDGTQPAIACDAALVNERGGVGVVLHLGTPGECMVEVITDDRQPAAHPWIGQLIVITGRGKTLVTGVALDREAQLMMARWARCEVLPRMTKKAQLLVIADQGEASANVVKAREYGIPTIDEPSFLIEVGIPSEAVALDQLAWARTWG